MYISNRYISPRRRFFRAKNIFLLTGQTDVLTTITQPELRKCTSSCGEVFVRKCDPRTSCPILHNSAFQQLLKWQILLPYIDGNKICLAIPIFNIFHAFVHSKIRAENYIWQLILYSCNFAYIEQLIHGVVRCPKWQP